MFRISARTEDVITLTKSPEKNVRIVGFADHRDVVKVM